MKVAVGLFLLLAASTVQAFQLQSSNNHHHHPLVSLTHQPPLLDNSNPTTKALIKKQSSYSIINSPQNAATQINRIVNRNTKNRQNYSKCLFGAPHSTLHKDLIVGNNSSSSSNSKSVQRSLRQLGITIASTLLIVTRTRQVDVAHAAATPLVVTHPTGVGSTAITPLLSTTSSSGGGTSYSGLTLIPSSLSQIISAGGGVGVGGLSPAIGEIIMSFAYIILALGISHWLGKVAEGGHVKLMKLMAWTNLADGEYVDSGVESVVGESASTKSSSEQVGGGGIRGLIGRYTYMIQLIVHEVTKAYRMGEQNRDSSVGVVVESSSSTKSTTEEEQVKVGGGTGIRALLGRYTYMMQLIVHEITKAYRMGGQSSKKKKLIPATASPTTTQEKDVMVDWSEYSNLIQQTNNKRKWKKQTSRRWSKVVRNGGELVYNKFAMMFERVANKSDVEEETKKATDLYQQKQFEQHHHHVHVPRSLVEENSYLDSLTKFGTGEEGGSSNYDKQQQGGATKGYLDTLSDDATKSTWGVYKDQVAKAKEEMKREDEVDYLREELVHVQNLLRDEQSMYQTSNQALNLVVEAQNEELKHARTAANAKHSTEDELKEFDIKAKEYDEAMKEVKEKEVKKKKGSGAPHKWIF